MAVVPISQGNRVRVDPISGQNFRPADMSGVGDAIGKGLQDIGAGLGQASEVQDRIDEQFDDTMSRQAALEYQTAAQATVSEFRAAQGGNAVATRTATDDSLEKLRTETIGKATNPRMTRMLQDRIAGYHAENRIRIGEHALEQLNRQTDDTQSAQLVTARDSAASDWDKPKVRQKHIDTGMAVISDIAQRKGWSPEKMQAEQFEYRSGADTAIIRNMVDADDVDAAIAYRADKRFSLADDERIDRMLRDPLETRQADSDLTELLSLAGAPTATPGAVVPDVPGVKQDSIRSAASQLGVAPAELAGLFNYESAGSMNPSKRGGDGGRYLGLWQAGPEEQRKYGVKPTNTFEEQTAAFVRFAKDRGYKPGMGWQKLYTTINAGNPHASVKAADSNGTQSDHYRNIEQTHFAAGAAFVGGRLTGGEATTGADMERVDELARAKVASGEWSHERAERVRNRANRQVSAQNAIRSQVESDALRSAQDVIDKLPGNKLMNFNQIPAEVRAKLSPSSRLALEADIAQNNKPVEPKAGSDRYFDLLDMSMNPARQKEFLKLDPVQLRLGISNEEYSRLRTNQTKMANGVGGEKKQLEMRKVRAAIARVAPDIGLELTGVKNDEQKRRRALRNQFTDKMVRAIEARGGAGEVDDLTIDGLARSMAQEVYAVGEDEAKPLFMQTGRVGVAVPNTFVAEVKAIRPNWSAAQIREYWISKGAPQ